MKDVWISGVTEKYPSSLLDGRLNAEASTIGLIWQDPLILDETKLSAKDFLSVDGRFYFEVAKQLRAKGVLDFNEVAVISNLEPNILDKFTEKGGYKEVNNIASIISERNKDSILDSLSKCNIILRLYNRGFNLEKEMVINNKKITPLEYFKSLKSGQIIDWYDAQLCKLYDGGYDMNLLEDEDVSITDDFIQGLADAKEYGIPYAKAGKCCDGKDMNVFPYLSSLTLGFTKKASHYVSGFSSSGKTSFWGSVIMSMALQEKVLIICNEQSSKVWKMNMLLFILYKHFHYTDVTKSKLMSGTFRKDAKQMEMVNKAKDYFNKHYDGRIHFIQLAENNFDIVKSKIRYYALQLGYGVVVFDTLKIADSNRRNDSLAGWEELVQYSRDLDILAKKLNICMCCSVQLAQGQKGNLFLGSQMLSGAKGIVEQLDTLLCLRDVYKEELDPNSKFFCAPFQKVLNETTGEYEERPYECDPKYSWKMCFLGKSRNSENSDSSGCAIMLKFFGAMAVWSEPCWCRPKHGYITDGR